MEKVTVEQTQNAIRDHQIKIWKVRECSICYAPITYSFDGDVVLLDTNCGCVTYRTDPLAMSVEEFIEQTFNFQSSSEVRGRMWESFIQAS